VEKSLDIFKDAIGISNTNTPQFLFIRLSASTRRETRNCISSRIFAWWEHPRIV